jgi:hypothetical protein
VEDADLFLDIRLGCFPSPWSLPLFFLPEVRHKITAQSQHEQAAPGSISADSWLVHL